MASEFHRVALSDGASLNVRFIAGVNDARPLVIALHGGPGGGNLNGTGFEFLADRYRVLLYDARGSGKSDVQGPFTHERWAADLDELRYPPIDSRTLGSINLTAAGSGLGWTSVSSRVPRTGGSSAWSTSCDTLTA